MVLHGPIVDKVLMGKIPVSVLEALIIIQVDTYEFIWADTCSLVVWETRCPERRRDYARHLVSANPAVVLRDTAAQMARGI